MLTEKSSEIIARYKTFINDKLFPCIGARAALGKHNVRCLVAEHMACPADDSGILQFLYDFVDEYRVANGIFYSAAILFKAPVVQDEKIFDRLLWTRLQALSDLDAKSYGYDSRVGRDPAKPDFSFSLKEESFYIIGLNPASNRNARRFDYPALVFNPHAQFEKLRETNRYEKMKTIVRNRDIGCSGSVNPMLDDFGRSSEAIQYSGLFYDNQWKCPLTINHGKNGHHSTP